MLSAKNRRMRFGCIVPTPGEGIPPSRLTLAELFKKEGYATACIGKWHLGFR